MTRPKPRADRSRVEKPRTKQSREEERQQIKNSLRLLIEAEIYSLNIERHLLKEDVKAALGVGDITAWMSQVEQNYVGSVVNQPATAATDPNRPKLKIVSKRRKRKKQ